MDTETLWAEDQLRATTKVRCVLGGHPFELDGGEVQLPNGWACGACVDKLLFPTFRLQADISRSQTASENVKKNGYKRFEEPHR